MIITSIVIVTREGYRDVIYLETDLPETEWPFDEHPSFQFTIQRGKGERYVQYNFKDIKYRIVQA